MNKEMLKSIMALNNDTQTTLASEMGMPQSAISARINGRTEFKQSEINFIRNRYCLSDEQTVLIFFEKKVS